MKASDCYLNTKGCCVSVCGLCVSQSPNPLPGDNRLGKSFLLIYGHWIFSSLEPVQAGLKYHVEGCYANQQLESRVLEYRLKAAA